MVDDIGPEGIRARIERRLGQTFKAFALTPLPAPRNHRGVHAQADGRSYVGVPVHLGLIAGDQMLGLADLAERVGGDIRITRQQNLVLTNVSAERLDEVVEALRDLGLPLDAGALRSDAVACTGEPHCNFSVTETKTRMDALVQLLEARFGQEADGLRMNLDGCPHACAHHWVGEIGFQGTTVRDTEGKRRQAYDVYLRGSLDRPAAIARAVFKRVPTEQLDEAVIGLVGGWVEARVEGETFRMFCDRMTDADLGRLAGREPAKLKEKA